MCVCMCMCVYNVYELNIKFLFLVVKFVTSYFNKFYYLTNNK